MTYDEYIAQEQQAMDEEQREQQLQTLEQAVAQQPEQEQQIIRWHCPKNIVTLRAVCVQKKHAAA